MKRLSVVMTVCFSVAVAGLVVAPGSVMVATGHDLESEPYQVRVPPFTEEEQVFNYEDREVPVFNYEDRTVQALNYEDRTVAAYNYETRTVQALNYEDRTVAAYNYENRTTKVRVAPFTRTEQVRVAPFTCTVDVFNYETRTDPVPHTHSEPPKASHHLSLNTQIPTPWTMMRPALNMTTLQIDRSLTSNPSHCLPGHK